jgi:hypothetical protein
MEWCKGCNGTEFPQAFCTPWNSAQRHISMTFKLYDNWNALQLIVGTEECVYYLRTHSGAGIIVLSWK